MAEHWVEIGIIDYVTKIAFTLVVYIPIYGLLVRSLSNKLAVEDA
jgi:hypothetical protein